MPPLGLQTKSSTLGKILLRGSFRYRIPPARHFWNERTREVEMRSKVAVMQEFRWVMAVLLLGASVAARPTTVRAQELPSAKPETVGLSSERLERITAKVQQTIDDKRIAGAVTLVAR